MSESDYPQVQIDEKIRENQRLLTAVEAASEVFRHAVAAQPDLVPHSGVLSWNIGTYSPDSLRIRRRYTEPNTDGITQRSLTTEIFPSALLDPVQRDVSILRLLNAISRWRLDEVNESIREHLRELDSEEEQNAVAHTH